MPAMKHVTLSPLSVSLWERCACWRAIKLKWSRGWSTSQHPQAATFFKSAGRLPGFEFGLQAGGIKVQLTSTDHFIFPKSGCDKHQLSAGKTTLRPNLSCSSKIWRLLAKPLCSNLKSFKKHEKHCFICEILRRCLKVLTFFGFCRAFFNHQPVLINNNNKASLVALPTASLGVFRIYTQGSCQCRLSQFAKTERVENYHNRIIELSSFHPSKHV